MSSSALATRRNSLVALDSSIFLLYLRRNEASLLYLSSFSSTICACFARYSAVYHGDRVSKAQTETDAMKCNRYGFSLMQTDS